MKATVSTDKNINEEKQKEIVVEAKDVCYAYPDGTKALQGVNLKVAKGEKLAVMGSNGSGKSTFFLHLNGVLKPESGEIFINGESVDYSRKGLLKVRKQVGIVFQDPDNQLFSANVMQEISFGVLNLGYSQEEVLGKVNKVIEELNITEFKDKPTHFLSGGQKKRVAIADILVMEPDIVILDEPASALDPKHARMIDGIVENLSRKGITVILSTHDVERALIWADRVVLFNKGRVLSEGTPEEIFSDDALMEETNLEKPTVMKIYEDLRRLEIIKDEGKIPRTAEELEIMIGKGVKG